MDLITTWRHLFSAVLRLGAHEGTVDQRLREAYTGLRQLADGSALPADARRDYEALITELNDLFGGAGRMDVRRASRLAKRVVALYDRVSKELK